MNWQIGRRSATGRPLSVRNGMTLAFVVRGLEDVIFRSLHEGREIEWTLYSTYNWVEQDPENVARLSGGLFTQDFADSALLKLGLIEVD